MQAGSASGPPTTWVDDDTLRVDDTTYSVFFGNPGQKHLRIFKPRVLINAYEPIIEEFRGGTVVELGIYRGGSTAYLAQRMAPRRLVALDLETERVRELDQFLEQKGLTERVVLHYGVDQADRAHVSHLVTGAADGQALDLVIDDASHRYEPTVASFETLFPLLRPGGLYVIEDWNPEDWLVASLLNALRSGNEGALAVIEARLIRELTDDDQPVGAGFTNWCARTVCDPSAPEHDLVRSWLDGLRRADAPQGLGAVRDHLDATIAQLEGGDVLHAPAGLASLATELFLALKDVHPAIGSMTVTPFWLAIRRGFTSDPTISVAELGADRLGHLADESWRLSNR